MNLNRSTGAGITFDDQVLRENAAAGICPGGVWPTIRFAMLGLHLGAAWASLDGHSAMRQPAEHHGPEFALLDVVTDGLGTLHDVTYLNAIGHGGAIGLTAKQLMAEVGDHAAEATSQLVRGKLAADSKER